jgi:hypothetical protein
MRRAFIALTLLSVVTSSIADALRQATCGSNRRR